jgi:hypothetical protein
MVGIVQVTRIINYNYTVKGKTMAEQVEDAKEDVTEVAGKAVDVVKS